ncbi:Two pore calcium channel protein 1 [Hibiscus syriacus]|uniref:Two pore calcium channel protein 1 n=1 Tax=Hibiscus syriacus TaxID=106335 RepID=A0A6A2Z4Z0_HIBSY|nr:Two pore calcium channel protein 1 [Hibiscus syriacus]
MDKPMLYGETSGGGGRRGRLYRRSEAITYGSPYQQAAALVDLAEDGVGLPEQILDKSSFGSAAKFYFIFIKFDIIWTLNYFALLPYLTATESIIYEVVTLIVLAIHTFFPISYEGPSIYWKRPLNLLKVICLLIMVADLLVFFIYLSPVAMNSLPFRVAPYVRVILFILSIRELRNSIIILAGMIGTYLNVLALWLLFLLFASWVAYVMFEDTEQGKTVFTSFGTTLYQMFVLFTTSNNPDVWIPAYKASRWYSIFFVLYVLIGVYFVTNLILAVVYDSFKGELAKQVSEMDRNRRNILCKAFDLIDDYNVGFLNKEQCIHLFEELNNYRSLPKISREEFELIFDELDDSRDFKINLDEFTDLCNAIGLRFQKEDTPPLFERFQIYRSPFSENLKAFVRSPKFGYIISFILLLNLFAVIVETTLDIENNSGQKVWQEVEFVFGWIYVLEMALKDSLPSSCQNAKIDKAPDACPKLQSFCCHILNPNSKSNAISWDYILYPMHLLLNWCTDLGGIVNAGNPNLDASELTENDYLLFNFNDYPNGMVTLFNLLVMGNWQVWMQSYKELTGTSWSLVYFISFYLVTVLLLLNLVVAFVLEAFFAEMDLEASGTGEEGDDKDAGSGKGRRRLAGTKTRSQRVDVLLHHMLSAELDRSHSSSSSA